jgi:energy-coupling factor transporter ATP-binding protein EcfA2
VRAISIQLSFAAEMDTINSAKICESNSSLFRIGSRVILVGSSGSGKTRFLTEIISKASEEEIFEKRPTKIYYFIHPNSTDIDKAANYASDISVEYITEMPDDQFRFKPFPLVIFDDFLSGADQDKVAEKLLPFFCRRCHHEQLYCFLTVQNLFSPSKNCRTIGLNANYIVLFKTYRNFHQIRYLANQLLGGDAQSLSKMYIDATSGKPFGYLMIDLHPLSDDQFRYKSNVLAESGNPCVVYVPLENYKS